MKPFSKLFLCASFGLATLAMGCAEMKTDATEGSGPAAMPSSAAKPSSTEQVRSVETGLDLLSPGSQGDTLETCLNRIPDDATMGQRLLATVSCERDAKNRASIEAVPGN